MATERTSMSPRTSTPSPLTSSDKSFKQPNSAIIHPPRVGDLHKDASRLCDVKTLKIPVHDARGGSVAGLLHIPPNYQSSQSHNTGAILVSGASGGVIGPSSIYPSIAAKLASFPHHGIPTLRLDYRYPGRNQYCSEDTEAAMDFLEDNYGMKRFVLVGWSFGSVPVFTVGGRDLRVAGCATVASQMASAEGVHDLAPTPVLLLHGTGDKMLASYCSQRLYTMYGDGGEREIKLFEGDDHSLRKNAGKAEEMLCNFIMRCADVQAGNGDRDVVRKE